MNQGLKNYTKQALCDILGCTPNDLFKEYHNK